jgi:hypothetical protein
MTFRRRWGTPVWHWTPECSLWPFPLQSEEREAPPAGAELCPQCQSKAPLDKSTDRSK